MTVSRSDGLTAFARVNDPGTSHEAAESLTPDRLRRSMLAVWECLEMWGPMTDTDLCAQYQRNGLTWGWPKQSESGIRSRRAELCHHQLVRPVGTVRLASGRNAIRWAVVIERVATNTQSTGQ